VHPVDMLAIIAFATSVKIPNIIKTRLLLLLFLRLTLNW